MKRFDVEITQDGFRLLLPGHKGDRFFEGSTLQLFPSTTAYSAAHHFRQYLQVRDVRFRWLPDLWLREDGSPPTRRWFTSRLRQYFSADISGHSLRAGGATALAVAGIPDDRICFCGRWSSDSYQLYLRKNPSIFLSTFT